VSSERDAQVKMKGFELNKPPNLKTFRPTFNRVRFSAVENSDYTF